MYPVRTRLIRHTPMFLGADESAYADVRESLMEDEGLRQRLQESMKQFERKMKRELIKAAATQAAINLSLNAIPIAGSALSLVSAFALGYQLERYQGKLEEEGVKMQERIEAKIEKTQGAMNSITEKVLEEEYPAAMEELFEGRQPVEGFEGLGWKSSLRRLKRNVTRPIKQVTAEISRVGDTIQEGIDVMRGKRAYEKAREEMRKMEQMQFKALDNLLKAHTEESKTPEYRRKIREQIKQHALQDPELSSLIQQHSTARPGVVPGIPSSARDRARLIIAGTVGVSLVMLMR